MSKSTAADLPDAARPLARLLQNPRHGARALFGWLLDDVLADLAGRPRIARRQPRRGPWFATSLEPTPARSRARRSRTCWGRCFWRRSAGATSATGASFSRRGPSRG